LLGPKITRVVGDADATRCNSDFTKPSISAWAAEVSVSLRVLTVPANVSILSKERPKKMPMKPGFSQHIIADPCHVSTTRNLKSIFISYSAHCEAIKEPNSSADLMILRVGHRMSLPRLSGSCKRIHAANQGQRNNAHLPYTMSKMRPW